MSATTHSTTSSAMVSRALNGALAGVAGGIVFGMLMAMMGMLPMIAQLVGSDSAVVGGIVHLVISAALGALFGLLVPATTVSALLGAGVVYGMLWWVLGPLVIMPARLGMPLFMINQTAWMSLMGHLIYGMVTAAVLFGLRRRAHS